MTIGKKNWKRREARGSLRNKQKQHHVMQQEPKQWYRLPGRGTCARTEV